MKDIALRLLRRMVEIPSLSGQEGELATYLVETMQQLGFHSYIDGAGNAVGERKNGDGSLILLLGHMDTVPGLIEVRQKDMCLYGRGVVDAKGSLATFICAVAALNNFSGRFIVVGAVEEEIASSQGARFLLDRYEPDVVLVGEPSGWSSVTLGYKGRVSLIYTVTRPGSHSAGPGQTAAEAGVAFWNQLAEYLTDLGKEQSVFYSPTPSLLRFEGSDRQASLDISCRIPPDFDALAFQQFLTRISSGGEVQLQEITPAVLMERNNPVAQALMQAIRQHGGQPKLKLKTGTSDMNIVSQHWHVPMVAYGPGDSKLDHTDNEHLDLEEYLRSIDVLADALSRLMHELTASRTAGVEQLPPENEQPSPMESYPLSDSLAGNLDSNGAQTGNPTHDPTYTPEEEQELSNRLQALGYLE